MICAAAERIAPPVAAFPDALRAARRVRPCASTRLVYRADRPAPEPSNGPHGPGTGVAVGQQSDTARPVPLMQVPAKPGRKQGQTPTVAAGLKIEKIAADLMHPHQLDTLPNGDMLAMESRNPGTEPVTPQAVDCRQAQEPPGQGWQGPQPDHPAAQERRRWQMDGGLSDLGPGGWFPRRTLQLLRPARGPPRHAAAPRPGRQDDQADYALGSHVTALGLLFSDDNALPAKYHGGTFISGHGSWDCSPSSGYRVTFAAFQDGKPVGLPGPSSAAPTRTTRRSCTARR